MPVSNDNQDYGQKDEQNNQNIAKDSSSPTGSKLTEDDLKGKKVDADLEQEKDRPAEQQK